MVPIELLAVKLGALSPNRIVDIFMFLDLILYPIKLVDYCAMFKRFRLKVY